MADDGTLLIGNVPRRSEPFLYASIARHLRLAARLTAPWCCRSAVDRPLLRTPYPPGTSPERTEAVRVPVLEREHDPAVWDAAGWSRLSSDGERAADRTTARCDLRGTGAFDPDRDGRWERSAEGRSRRWVVSEGDLVARAVFRCPGHRRWPSGAGTRRGGSCSCRAIRRGGRCRWCTPRRLGW